MSEKQFWKKSWDHGLEDLDPKLFEISYTDAVRPTFEKYPNQLACEFLGVEISYKEFDEMSNQFANMLLKNGFSKGDIVGINLPNSPQYLIAWLGALKAGCIVSGVSPLLSATQIHYQINDLGTTGKNVALVTLDAIFEGHITKIAGKLPQLKIIVATNIADFLPKIKQVLAKALKKVPKGKVTPISGKKIIQFKEILNQYSKNLPSIDISPDDLAYIQYTGGTTGPPKGAMLTHRNAIADVLIVRSWLQWEETEGKGRALSGFPFFHIAGLFFNECCVYMGWSQFLIPNPRDTNHICKCIKKYQPTVLVNVPSLFQLLMKNPKFKDLDHSKLECCISAASPFPKESQEELERIVGQGKLLEVYGMTETSPLTVMNPSKGKKKLGHIGLPILNTDIKLVDPDTGEEVGIGQAGEICIKGPQVMKGYFNKPDETEKVFDKDGYLHTGDVAIFDEEGYLRIVDRTKDMIIVSGFKVFSSKVEDILTKHPAIDLIALIGVPNPERPGSEIVKAFIQLNPEYQDKNKEALKEEIINFAKEKCSPYEVPKLIEFVDEIPLTAVGKVDKKVLRAKIKK
ncbi:MAG: AMP-binding protein [Promethearchaeota archaeon]